MWMLSVATSLGGEAEPVTFATANLTSHNKDPRAAAEAVVAAQADVTVLVECSRESLALDTLDAGGLRLLVDGRDPTAWGLCIVGRVEGEGAMVAAPWGGPCVGPIGVLRVPLGSSFVSVLGVHLPSRLPECSGTTDAAVRKLASLVRDGRLVAAFGPGQAGDAVVIAGDFGSEGRKLNPLVAVGLVDAVEVSGQRLTTWSLGPIRTWPDHVLVPRAWDAGAAGAFELPGSNHRGVWQVATPG